MLKFDHRFQLASANSRYIQSSLLSQLNRTIPPSWMRIADEIFNFLRVLIEISEICPPFDYCIYSPHFFSLSLFPPFFFFLFVFLFVLSLFHGSVGALSIGGDDEPLATFCVDEVDRSLTRLHIISLTISYGRKPGIRDGKEDQGRSRRKRRRRRRRRRRGG